MGGIFHLVGFPIVVSSFLILTFIYSVEFRQHSNLRDIAILEELGIEYLYRIV